jgi:hypothetical protein
MALALAQSPMRHEHPESPSLGAAVLVARAVSVDVGIEVVPWVACEVCSPVAATVLVEVMLAVAGPVVTPVPVAELPAVTWPVPVLVRGSVEVTVALCVRVTVVSVWVADLVLVLLAVPLCVTRLVDVEVRALVPFVVPLGLTQSL